MSEKQQPDDLEVSTEEEVLDGPTDEKPKSIYELFETDETMEQQGIVVDFGPYGEFKVARASGSNIKYSETVKRYNKPYQKMLKRGTMPEKLARQVLAKVYAESIVLNWKRVIGRDGKEIPYTTQNVVKVLLDLPDLFSQIVIESLNAELYRKDYVEEAAKN